MNEDEKTIEDIKEIINRCKECKFATCEQCEINWTQIKTVEHLLDLYNKEKEKNKELEKELCDIHSNFCKFNWKESNGVQVYNQLKELYNSIYRTKRSDYINKDKIKDEVEYIRFMVDDDNKPSEIVKEVNLYLDLFLQELLEERN